MKGIRVEPTRKTVQAQAGATWGDFDHETAAFGLATPGGAVSTTGIAGLTLGGGVGWLSRKYGLTCDNLLSVDVVTAKGAVLTASETENADLFWGVRGGGGNFGIVTSFEYQLHPVSQVLAGPMIYPLDQAKDVFHFLADYLPTVPDELTVLVIFMTAPAGPPFPADLQGQVILAPTVCYTGPIEEGERVLQPLRSFGTPAADFIAPIPYVALQSMFDAQVPPGLHSYWKSVYLPDLSPGAIETLVECGASMTSPSPTCTSSSSAGRQAGLARTRRCAASARWGLSVTWNPSGLSQRKLTGISPGCETRGQPYKRFPPGRAI